MQTTAVLAIKVDYRLYVRSGMSSTRPRHAALSDNPQAAFELPAPLAR